MQFDADPLSVQAITGYGVQGIAVNGVWHSNSLLLGSDGMLHPWLPQTTTPKTKYPFTVDAVVTVLHFLSDSANPAYELVLLGTGQKQVFLPPELLQPFIAAGVTVEVMNTPAACRTYNIVMAEDRKVLAALWLE